MTTFDTGRRPTGTTRGESAGGSRATTESHGGKAFGRILDSSRARRGESKPESRSTGSAEGPFVLRSAGGPLNRRPSRPGDLPASPSFARFGKVPDGELPTAEGVAGRASRLRESSEPPIPSLESPLVAAAMSVGTGPPSGFQEGDSVNRGAASARTSALAGAAGLAARMVDEIVRAVDTAQVAGRGQIDVRFELGSLGGGRVRVAQAEKGLDIHLELEGARARELATAGLDDLRRGLEARGLDLASLELAGAGRLRPDQPATARSPEGAPKDPRRDGDGGSGRGRDDRWSEEQSEESAP